MNDYKTGAPAYIEYVKKDGNVNMGVWLVTRQDRWNLELKDEEMMPIVAKKDILVYETDYEKWPKWLKTL